MEKTFTFSIILTTRAPARGSHVSIEKHESSWRRFSCPGPKETHTPAHVFRQTLSEDVCYTKTRRKMSLINSTHRPVLVMIISVVCLWKEVHKSRFSSVTWMAGSLWFTGNADNAPKLWFMKVTGRCGTTTGPPPPFPATPEPLPSPPEKKLLKWPKSHRKNKNTKVKVKPRKNRTNSKLNFGTMKKWIYDDKKKVKD